VFVLLHDPVQGFPSYCEVPEHDAILTHTAGLTRYGALRYYARLPTCIAVSGSLTLCAMFFLLLPSDPAVASSALAIRISFPLIGAVPASCSRTEVLATLGKHKKGLFPGERGLSMVQLKI